MKLSLETLPKFNLQKIFKAIDLNNYNFIDKQQIKKFLYNQGFKKLTENTRAINSIVKRLNKYRRLKISFQDFAEQMSPSLTSDFIGSSGIGDPISIQNKVQMHETSKDVFSTSPYRVKKTKVDIQ